MEGAAQCLSPAAVVRAVNVVNRGLGFVVPSITDGKALKWSFSADLVIDMGNRAHGRIAT